MIIINVIENEKYHSLVGVHWHFRGSIHGITPQKIVFSIITAMRSSNPTNRYIYLNHRSGRSHKHILVLLLASIIFHSFGKQFPEGKLETYMV
jgi:hypothetical protein